MKKLANLIALFILVSVNIITPITYAEDEDPEVWDKYDCRPDGGDGWRYYVCEPAPEGDYSCWSEEEEGYVCGYDITEAMIYGCNLEDDSYYCPINYYNMNGSTEEGYYFEPSRGVGEFYCGYGGGVGGLGLSSDLREMNSRGDYYCSGEGGSYYGCSESGNGFFCPQLYRYQLNREKGEYNFYKDEDGGYTCDLNNFSDDDSPEDVNVVEDAGDTYICGWLDNCYEDMIGLIAMGDYDIEGYSCPIYYSCDEEEGTIYCQENTSGQYECKSNLSVGEKGLRNNMGEYSCSNGVNTYICDWDGDYWYEDEYGRYGRFECEDPSDDGDDECLGEGAEYDDELGQCVYKVPGYDGKEIVIMSSNLGATKNNLTGLYYQWGTGYGFPGYNGDTGGEESIEYQLSNEDMAIFDDYPTAEFSVWPTDTDPCPEHFHVPSTTEWNNLLISWCENNEECDAAELTRHDSLVNHWALNDVSAENNYQGNYRFEDEVYSFVSDLNFPLGGSLDGYHANMLGLMGDYWAKEFIKTDKHGNKSSWGFTVYPRGGLGPVSFISNHAASVRCFADVEEGVEEATPVALDLYIGGCGESDFIAPTSAIEVLEDSVLCNNDGYRGRKFVASGEAVDLDDLDGFLPEGYNRTWYLDDYQTTKLTDNTPFTEDTRLYAFEEITPITLTVTKVRNDADNQDGIRPESVTVYLYEDNNSTPVVSSRNLISTVILSGGNEWTATVPNLLPFHNIDYIWEENAVSGYESSQNTDGFITTLTNTHTPAVVTKYTVTFNSNDGSTINPVEVVEGQPVTKPTDPKRNGYSFGGWYTDPELTNEYKFTEPVIGPLTLHAKWTENKPSGGNSGGYSGGGGGHSKGGGGNKSDVKSVENEPTTPTKEENKSDPKPVVPGKGINNTDKTNPNQELFDAYEWAYANGLTKYANMSDARMNDILNRQEMAKITTIFASKFKNNTPNEDKRDFCSQYPDLWKTTEDMQEYIIQSCELGYMGYRANGIDALDRFRPYTPVSVAEVSIILSRIMWQNKYAINENLWYQGHLHAVYENNLLDNITKPFDYIIRKDAYIMLYRISKTL